MIRCEKCGRELTPLELKESEVVCDDGHALCSDCMKDMVERKFYWLKNAPSNKMKEYFLTFALPNILVIVLGLIVLLTLRAQTQALMIGIYAATIIVYVVSIRCAYRWSKNILRQLRKQSVEDIEGGSIGYNIIGMIIVMVFALVILMAFGLIVFAIKAIKESKHKPLYKSSKAFFDRIAEQCPQEWCSIEEFEKQFREYDIKCARRRYDKEVTSRIPFELPHVTYLGIPQYMVGCNTEKDLALYLYPTTNGWHGTVIGGITTKQGKLWIFLETITPETKEELVFYTDEIGLENTLLDDTRFDVDAILDAQPAA